ncbi:MarR family winged helix-turn-helix transcriptional regulator [Gracilibacillus salinarum]|uniref:MarR family transcriptional regulator n=2 Tax=Gracilibacillus TaxID=74385 RepID=A0ABY4GLS2_9BACI|nr:MarR family transcriptional regulator [Gracilibacillus salinarum]UOQ84905.1 MarR family transcriptional regulator [Gracilibacillus salinarum]
MQEPHTFFYQLILLYRPFEKKLNDLLQQHDLHRAQWIILYYLSNFGPSTNVEISTYQGVEKPTITRTMSRLEALGLVTHRQGNDKREKKMMVTDYGNHVYLKVRQSIDQFEKEILAGISEEDQVETMRIFKEIRKNLTK